MASAISDDWMGVWGKQRFPRVRETRRKLSGPPRQGRDQRTDEEERGRGAACCTDREAKRRPERKSRATGPARPVAGRGSGEPARRTLEERPGREQPVEESPTGSTIGWGLGR